MGWACAARIVEQKQPGETPLTMDSKDRLKGGALAGRRFGGAFLALGLVLALGAGTLLGAIPWRYRKQIWQLQGALAGAVVGFVLGRLSAPEAKP
jgi:hypothetical protein